jgi:hypothetical protein
LCQHFRFILYWRKPTGAKAAHRMLMKLSLGVIHEIRDTQGGRGPQNVTKPLFIVEKLFLMHFKRKKLSGSK